MCRAIAWRKELDRGGVAGQADIARREGIRDARVTQILGLLRLAPEIQASIPARAAAPGRAAASERRLGPVVRVEDPAEQVAAFCEMLRKTEGSASV